MKQNLRMIPIFLAAALALAPFGVASMVEAQTAGAGKAAVTQAAQPYEVPEGSVTVYGQTLSPHLLRFREQDSDYTWDDLKPLMPKLLPDALSQSYGADEVCARLQTLNNKYLSKSEELTNYLIYKMEFVVNAGRAAPPADLALTGRLSSKSPQALKDLFDFLPDEKERIKVAKAITIDSLAMIMLRDAALANCPDYAKKNNLFALTVSTNPN